MAEMKKGDIVRLTEEGERKVPGSIYSILGGRTGKVIEIKNGTVHVQVVCEIEVWTGNLEPV